MAISSKYEKLKLWLDIFLSFLGLVNLAVFMFLLGFQIKDEYLFLMETSIVFITSAFVLQEVVRFLINNKKSTYLKSRWFESIVAFILLIDLLVPGFEIRLFVHSIPGLSYKEATLVYLGLIQFIILFTVVVKVLRYNYLITELKIHPGAIFAISFAILIIIGTVFLLLPNATVDNGQLSFANAIFTSTSAVCVTGLVVVDTAKEFTLLGKSVILFLIQIGGLGVMTLTTFFAIFLSGGVSFRFKILMKDLLSRESLSEVRSLLVKIFIYTITIEIVGAILLYWSMGGSLTDIDLQLMYDCIFHSVSAFCNAGFSIYNGGLDNNMLGGNYYYYNVIISLIILGGLGFAVLSNLTRLNPFGRSTKKIRHRLTVSTKIILSSTAILLIAGTVMIYIFEPYVFDPSLNFWEKLYQSFFLSVTSRTAGFNISPTGTLSVVTVLILLPLMWVGASPGSTGGGIKTTTISVAFLSLFNLTRGKDKVELFDREISQNSVRKAFMVIFSSLIFLGVAVILLVWVEPDKQPINLIFEAVSAISTVGLSIDITQHLGTGGKYLIIMLMFIGRIGVLTFFLSFIRGGKTLKYTLPKTEIVVG